jgi:hypothetical protein
MLDVLVLPQLLVVPIISVLIGMAWMGAMRSCANAMVYGTLIGQGLVLAVLSVVSLSFFWPLIFFFGTLFVMYFLLLFCARKNINLTVTLIEQAASVVQVHPQIFVSSVLLMTLGAIVYGACIAAALLLFTNGECVLSNSTSVDPKYNPNATSAPGDQWQLSNAAIPGLSFVGFALLWSVEVFSAMRFYVVSFVTGVWYFKASGMAAQRGGSGTVTNPVTTATKLAFTKSFGTICLTGLIMYIVELLRRMAKKQSQNNGLTGVLIACCINCLVAYLEFITRFALTLHALTGDDLCTSARTFTSHLNRHGFSAVWVNWMASWVFHFSAFVLSLLITAICLVITSHPHSVESPPSLSSVSSRSSSRLSSSALSPASYSTSSTRATRASSSTSTTAPRASPKWPRRSSSSPIPRTCTNINLMIHSLPWPSRTRSRTPRNQPRRRVRSRAWEYAAAHGVRACAPHCQRVRCQVRPGSSPSSSSTEGGHMVKTEEAAHGRRVEKRRVEGAGVGSAQDVHSAVPWRVGRAGEGLCLCPMRGGSYGSRGGKFQIHV